MSRKPELAALLLALTPVAALSQQIDDPANLMGERVSPPALADTLPINHGAPALEQLLRKLRTRASMMLIVAHPDDEDSGLLTYESRGMGARVAMLTLTRGEGGQNLMTGDFNDALGLIRTQELLAEDRYTGTDQFFGTEVDFGFSKTKEESFKQWTHERVLYDAVRAVRLYRPLILASVFIGGVTDGHGQHQVSGEITQEVFLAAADPKVFPEMGLPPWAPLRVYARVPFAPITDKGMFDYATGKYLPPHFHNYVTGVDTTTPPQATVTIHEGEVPNLPSFHGMSYVQWARQGLALQKTQIGANFRIPPAGRVDVGYTLYGSRTSAGGRGVSAANQAPGKAEDSAPGHSNSADEDLFTGIDISLGSIADLAPEAAATLRATLSAIDHRAAEAQRLFNPAHPELTSKPLSEGMKLLNDLIRDTAISQLPLDQKFNVLHELYVKRLQFNDALILAFGVETKAVAHLVHKADGSPRPAITTIPHANTGDTVEVSFRTTMSPLSGAQLEINGPEGAVATMASGTPYAASFKLKPEGRPQETCPYFERTNNRSPVYEVSSRFLRNAPAKPPFAAGTSVNFGWVQFFTQGAVQNGEAALQVVPPVNVSLTSKVGIFKPSSTGFPVEVKLATDNPTGVEGVLRIELPAGWSSAPQSFPFSLKSDAESRAFTFLVQPFHPTAETSYTLKAQAEVGTVNFTRGYRPAGYPGLPYSEYCTPALFTATAVDVVTAPQLKLAYLPGTGDEVPEFLPSLGVTPTLLSPKDLTAETLRQYDAVVLGVRAYSAHPELEGTGSAALNQYAKEGGVVIAQYNSGGFDPASAPYPYTLPGDSAHNVVDEDQPVRLLAPDNPLLTWPNKITSADFDHWIEERGHGFASEWAPAYTPLLETHDPDQDPQKGGLLVAKVGKGAYIYCAFALYRQLPEGVPGAYRLLANLVSYAKNPGR